MPEKQGMRSGFSPLIVFNTLSLEFITSLKIKSFLLNTTLFSIMAGILDKLRSIFEKEEEKEVKEMADPAEEANEYMKKKMLFTPRMFKVTNTVAPDVGKKFADFYESVWADGALPRKIKELMFMSIGVAYCSPRCIIHVIPAMRAGATSSGHARSGFRAERNRNPICL
jgi:alkylhydroperoxidase/carboxymuconolactone decarboxylase family protein YurZ